MGWVPGLVLDGVEVGPVAHGGHCVARVDGRVVFVRHALPGERVRLRLTEVGARFSRGDAIGIERATDGRVRQPCPVSGPGGCGGCDFQHAALPAQRELKRAVVAEQLQRLAGITWAGEVEAATASENGLGWRTRMKYRVTRDGRLGLRRSRSHELVAVPERGCPIATVPVTDAQGCRAGAEVLVAGRQDPAVLVDGELVSGSAVRTERAASRSYEVAAAGFWQVHPGAADLLSTAVVEGLSPTTSERAWDLYCGVGLFSGVLADVGVTVKGVEYDRTAVRLARRNVPEATFDAGRVEHVIGRWPRHVDLVVLDPPRTGAGRAVVELVASRRPRAVAYVACDPASLARDLGTFAGAGYGVTSLRAFDLFPMTHHVECVAILEPRNAGR